MLLLIALLLLFLIFVGVGFAAHILWWLAVISLVVLVVLALTRRF